MRARQNSSFGPVSTVNTAPVAIGNSIRGSKARVVNTASGARVVGRDFAFAVASTSASITNWELVGGMPLTPCVLPSSILRNYAQMYANFKVHKMVVHYITSSPTSQAGDIMFYYERDRKSPSPDYSSSSFLPFVLSDPNTIIGPQWTNHSLIVDPVQEWKSTAFGLNADLNEDAPGAVFLYSKTNSTNSPGYVLIDYDISFKEMSVNPRAGTLPVSRGQCNVISVGKTATTVVGANTTISILGLQGNGLNGSLTTLPAGTVAGDIFKFVISAAASITNNTWTLFTLQNLLASPAQVDVPLTIDDGFTCYLVYSDVVPGTDSPTFSLYPTLESALSSAGSGAGAFKYAASVTSGSYTLVGTAHLVASLNNTFQQVSY
jgi:hypothetical protein